MTLRELFIEWLTGSRYLQWLEHQHMEQRNDYTERLAEKDRIIHEKSVEIAGLKLECDRMRLVLLPMGSPVGAVYAERFNREHRPAGPPVPDFGGPKSWEAELQELMEEDQHGVHGEGRTELNQSGADAAPQPQP